MERGLISVIIPTYNRAHLIGETLSSIQKQTYLDWECIVVDDGSSDNTDEVVNSFIRKDSRFKFYERPRSKPKGANACRNFGFEKSKGDFINWFDSDDLMLETNLEKKIKIFDEDTDFVVANSINFDDSGTLSRPYELNYDLPITPENFLGIKIGWITDDVLIRRSAVNITFNEKLQSSQEYNFFSRLLFITNKGKYVKEDLAKRKLHGGSIQIQLQLSQNKSINSEAFINEKILLEDINKLASEKTIKRSINRIIRFSYELSEKHKMNYYQYQTVGILREYGFYEKLFFYLLWCLINLSFGKGYVFLKKSRI